MGKRVMSFLLGFMLIITYVSSAVAAKGESKFQYDTKDRLIEMVDSEGTIQYQYDENGNLIRKNKTNNLLMNPSFDIYLGTNNVADNWGAWKNNADLPTSSEVVQWPVDSGVRAQKMSASSLPQGNLFVLAQKVALEPNRQISASVRALVENVSNAKVLMTVDCVDANGTYLYTMASPTLTQKTGDYTTLSVSGMTSAGTRYGLMQLYIISTGSNGSGTVYWDSASLKYAESNLLSNGSMEGFTGNRGIADSWGAWKNNVDLPTSSEVVQWPVDSGVRAQKMSASSLPQGNLFVLAQKVALEPNRQISASVRALVENVSNAKVLMTVDCMDANGTYLYTMASPTLTQKTGDYTTLSVSGTTSAGTRYGLMQLYIISTGSNGSGTVYWDSASLKYAESNLLSNGSMEGFTGNRGIADSWGAWKNNVDLPTLSEVVQWPVDSGIRAQKMSASSLPQGNLFVLAQKVALEPNRQISASVRALVENVSNAKVLMTVDCMDANGNYLYTMASPTLTQKTDNYTTLTVNGTTSAGTQYGVMQLYIISTGNNGSGTVYWDSASLRKSN
ncbi:hypothetical protein ACJ7K1_03695 [Paenibacillus elgii]